MIKKSLFILAVSSMVFADTTMCFKKSWEDPSTVETTVLDGGKCSGTKTLAQMKSDGWIVNDMKLSSSSDDIGMNYVYILKKDKSFIDRKSLKENMLILENEKIENEKKIALDKDIKEGKRIYTNSCIQCHGKFAKEKAYNTARALIDLTSEDMEISIREYDFDQKDNGMAMYMKPYASSMTPTMTKQVHKYIQTLK